MIRYLKRNFFYGLVLVIPLILSISVFNRFQSTYSKNLAMFNSQIGAVAGDKKTPKDTFVLPDNVPIISNSQVLNFDSSVKSSSITYETTANEDQIKKFYKKFLDDNGFSRIDEETYAKGNKELNIKIDKNIVVINYFER